MRHRVIIERRINIPPDEEVNKRLEELGNDWEVVSAHTISEVFGIIPGTDSSQHGGSTGAPLHHCIYTTTVVVKQVS
jgi:hypothetical protein